MIVFKRKIMFIGLVSCLLVGCEFNRVAVQKHNFQAAQINAKLGLVYLRQKQPVLAKMKLLKALKQAPYDSNVHAAYGSFLASTGNHILAQKHYLYAIKYAGLKGRFWHDYGAFLYQQNRYIEALHYFLLAANDSKYLYVAKAYVDASNTALKLGKNVLAKQYLRAALLYDSNIFSDD